MLAEHYNRWADCTSIECRYTVAEKRELLRAYQLANATTLYGDAAARALLAPLEPATQTPPPDEPHATNEPVDDDDEDELYFDDDNNNNGDQHEGAYENSANVDNVEDDANDDDDDDDENDDDDDENNDEEDSGTRTPLYTDDGIESLIEDAVQVK